MSPPMTPVCNDTLEFATNPLFWTFKTLHLLFGVSALGLNVALAFVAAKSTPLSTTMRRVITASALSHALLAGYVLTKSLHAFLSLIFGFRGLMATAGVCKLQEAPFMFAYLQCAVLFFCFAAERARMVLQPIDKDPVLDSETRASKQNTCCMWLVVATLLSLAVIITLLLFGVQYTDSTMHLPVCNSLLGMRTLLTMCFFSSVLLCYLASVTLYMIVSSLHKKRAHLEPARVLATIRLGNFLLSVLGVWGVTSIVNGALMLAVLMGHWQPTEHLLYYVLEGTFYLMPCIAALVHPLACVWFISPIKFQVVASDMVRSPANRDLRKWRAEKAKCKVLEQVIPEEIVSLPGSEDISWRTSNASEYLDIKIDLVNDELAMVRAAEIDLQLMESPDQPDDKEDENEEHEEDLDSELERQQLTTIEEADSEQKY